MRKFYKFNPGFPLSTLIAQVSHPFALFKSPLKWGRMATLLVLIICGTHASAQQTIKVSGTVADGVSGKPLPGVSVRVKNSTEGISTGTDGKYAITVKRGAVLVFSFIGYAPVERTANQAIINVALQDNPNSLSEVVVLGYGSASKTNVASSTSTVSVKDFKDAVITDVNQALQGRATGVQVTELSGQPGTDAVVRIRGNNSLSGDNTPLYVVDGFPMPPYAEAGGMGTQQLGGLYGLNPNDVESMTILKDAAATAIYGSRGANGVILIKTKSGSGKDQKIEYVNKTTFGVAKNPYPMMN